MQISEEEARRAVVQLIREGVDTYRANAYRYGYEAGWRAHEAAGRAEPRQFSDEEMERIRTRAAFRAKQRRSEVNALPQRAEAPDADEEALWERLLSRELEGFRDDMREEVEALITYRERRYREALAPGPHFFDIANALIRFTGSHIDSEHGRTDA